MHPESCEHLHRTLSMIRDGDAKAGLVFNPATPLKALEPVIDLVDLVLIMSVNPGFGGQAFIPSSLEKLRQARGMIDACGRDIRLQIDGGIKIDNIGSAAAAGADAFVAGTAIFGADDYATTISAMRNEIADA